VRCEALQRASAIDSRSTAAEAASIDYRSTAIEAASIDYRSTAAEAAKGSPVSAEPELYSDDPFAGDTGDGIQLEREEPPYESSASLRLATGPLVGPVLCRVVSIVLARANCPMDRMDDAMLICDALSAHAPTHAADGHLTFSVATRGGQFELRVGDLAAGGASRLVQDTMLPGVGSVLERMADELRIEPAVEGTSEELVLGLSF
jgi:hypothetical protein